MIPVLIILFVQFTLMSLLAFGGASAVIQEIYKQSVIIHQWVSPDDFSKLYAIARTIPGPNVLFVTLIGFKAAGFIGGFVSTLGMIAPSSFLTFFISQYWSRFKEAPWKQSVILGISSVVIGFICTSTFFLLKTIATTKWHLLMIIATAAIVFLGKKINPLWLILVGAIIGFLFL